MLFKVIRCVVCRGKPPKIKLCVLYVKVLYLKSTLKVVLLRNVFNWTYDFPVEELRQRVYRDYFGFTCILYVFWERTLLVLLIYWNEDYKLKACHIAQKLLHYGWRMKGFWWNLESLIKLFDLYFEDLDLFYTVCSNYTIKIFVVLQINSFKELQVQF